MRVWEDPPHPLVSDLQAGLEKQFGWNILKVQVSFISAIAGMHWALEPNVSRYLKVVGKIKPSRWSICYSWDLPMVLNAFTVAPFESLESMPLP